MNKIEISIILPVYNGSDWLEKAVRSVFLQTFESFELIIVNDGSTDDSDQIIKKLASLNNRIQYVYNPKNLGIPGALNLGISIAKGKYIARIDQDDQWSDQDKLKKQFDFLENNSDYVLVGTGVIIVSKDQEELTRYLLPESDKEIRNRILSKNYFVHSSVMFRKEVVAKLGGYDESLSRSYIEDYDLWLKLGTVGKFCNLPIYAVRFTLHSNNISSKKTVEQIKAGIKLVNKYKDSYPNYFNSLTRGYLRLLIYGFFSTVPFFKIKNKGKNLLNNLIYIKLRSSYFGLLLTKIFRRKKYKSIKRKAKVIKDFQSKYNLQTFIETGTYLGETIYEIKDNFNNIYSIELDPSLYKNAKNKFSSLPQIRIMQGDSAKILAGILKSIKTRVLFWLDAHTSGGITAQGDKVTPISEELMAIKGHMIKDHIILIDDAESFIGTNDYPAVDKIKSILQEINPEYKLEIKENIIRIYI